MANEGGIQATIEASPDEIYDIELEHSLLEANEKLAKENRALLDQHGTTAIDFMGAIGSGKTTLIAKLVEKLKGKMGVAVFNGDATTSNDAASHTRFIRQYDPKNARGTQSNRSRRGVATRIAIAAATSATPMPRLFASHGAARAPSASGTSTDVSTIANVWNEFSTGWPGIWRA